MTTHHRFSRRPILALGFLLLLGLHAFGCAGLARPGLAADQLHCEYLQNPLGVEEPAPRLGWIVTSDRRAQAQSAYRILVASSPQLLDRNQGDLWDSGKVASAATSHIPYLGAALASRQTCYWKVMSWNGEGEPGPWSLPSQWEMGLLNPADWTAQWVQAAPPAIPVQIVHAEYKTADGKVSKDVTETVSRLIASGDSNPVASNENLGGDPARDIVKRLAITYTSRGTARQLEIAENAPIVLPTGRLPFLRRSFVLDKPVRSARIYSTALGIYELRLNGARVGDQHLAPGWTDYRKRVQYQVFDVTAALHPGKNVLGALVAPGWFAGHAGLFNAFQFYGKVPALCAQLEVTYTDGSTDCIITDASWKLCESPIVSADILQGENYDATAELPGWDAPGLNDDDWQSATVRDESRNLHADISEPIRTLKELPSRSVGQPSPGRYVFDLGQNMVGVVRLKVRAPRGTVITIRHAEVLNRDGTIYTANLRGAACTDTYVCRGGDAESWQPRFTLHGFRYVELAGLPTSAGAPALDTVTGIVIGSDLPAAGVFECSDPRVNQLQSNIIWGLRGNYVSIPTDCPQRDERMGWMADAQVFCPTATLNADIAPFMSKWMLDVIDAQRADGAHSDVAPAMKGLNYGTPAWGDAGVIIPWTIYENYGDTRILGRSVDSMIRWVQWCRQNSTGLIRDRARGNDYGDWLSINADTPKDLIGTAYFAHVTDLLARTLAVLGRDQEAGTYRQLFTDIKTAFNSRFVASDGRLLGNTQCAYVLALKFNLLSDADRARAAQYLQADIRAKDWHLSTGFVGVSHLLAVLTDSGLAETAHRLLMQDTMPSWLFSVKHGATTIWERWNGWTPETGPHPDPGMNSFNHYSLGSCGRWLYESVAGIACDPETPGYQSIIIRPRLGPNVTFARATYRSIRGSISSDWAISDGQLTLKVTIPANTTATVFVPTGNQQSVKESGKSLGAAEGVKVVRQDADATVLSVGSGRYTFTVPYAAASADQR